MQPGGREVGCLAKRTAALALSLKPATAAAAVRSYAVRFTACRKRRSSGGVAYVEFWNAPGRKHV